MSLSIPEEKRLKRFPLELQKQNDLYWEMLTLSAVMVDVGPDECVGIMLEESIGEETSTAVMVSNTTHRYTYGTDLVFNKVINCMPSDRWVAVFQINESKICTGVVFVNDTGMRIEITQQADVFWSFKEIRCSNYASSVTALPTFPKSHLSSVT
jgi:hypothetical protein